MTKYKINTFLFLVFVLLVEEKGNVHLKLYSKEKFQIQIKTKS